MQATFLPSDFELTIAELEVFRSSAVPEAEEKQRHLRQLEREAAGKRAQLEALRARHEQAWMCRALT